MKVSPLGREREREGGEREREREREREFSLLVTERSYLRMIK